MIKKFSLPGFFEKYDIVMSFLYYYKDNREKFYNDRIIDSFYGTPQGFIWQGGRQPRFEGNIFTYEEMFKELKEFNSINIRYVFTNCLINETMINDYKCNNYLKQWLRPQDAVILNNALLIKHFKINYPNTPIIYSTTLDITNIDEINEITKNNIYVLNYNYNNNNAYLNQLQNKHNIEIICAEPCVKNCPNRLQHYKSISKSILDLPFDENDIIECPFNSTNNSLTKCLSLPHAITNERIEELSNQGILYFKISGRTLKIPAWLETILYYLALPEYRDEIRQKLLNIWW